VNDLIIPKKSSAVADELGVPYFTLYNLLRYRKIPLPERDSSGDFVWSPSNIDAAKKAIANVRGEGDVPTSRGGLQ
jgi:hypothetical protein